MLIKRRQHRVPELNTTSTADISFMLLIFFLVTTSMDIDRGLVRMLPPMDDDTAEEQPPLKVSKENTMEFVVLPAGRVTLNGKPVTMDTLHTAVANFVRTRGKDHLIYLDARPTANYDTYFKLQNELVAAYTLVRNETAKQRFGKAYALCTEEQKTTVRDLCPQRITETYDTDEKEGGQQ
jgi:biopolymer transport protein ExbD